MFVCTGNICRSPMAAALLRARLRDVAPEVEVASAGLLFDDRPAEPNGAGDAPPRPRPDRPRAAADPPRSCSRAPR
ncbi:MAG: hypothetical protein R2711_06000 [Acidimicrobiales bacterium]